VHHWPEDYRFAEALPTQGPQLKTFSFLTILELQRFLLISHGHPPHQRDCTHGLTKEVETAFLRRLKRPIVEASEFFLALL